MCACGLGLALVLQGCTSARTIEVSSELGPGAKLGSQATTFAWMPDPVPATSDWHQVPYLRVRFRELVQSRLQAKGYTYQPGPSADILLSDRMVRHVMDDPMRLNRRLRYALLALDAINSRTNQVTWRAFADIELNPATSERQVDATLRVVVRRMLRPVPRRSDASSAEALP